MLVFRTGKLETCSATGTFCEFLCEEKVKHRPLDTGEKTKNLQTQVKHEVHQEFLKDRLNKL